MSTSRRHVRQLRRLQQMQEAFDATRGFNFENAREVLKTNFRTPGLGADVLLQFSALALCGETGELANSVKKAVRASMLGENSAAHRDSAGDELGDVLAYLLKISNLLEEDLAIRYLRQMCENALRFPAIGTGAGCIVMIAGPSGAGKSTTIRDLSKRLPTVPCYFEGHERNPFLVASLTEGNQDAIYQSQEWFLRQQVAFLKPVAPTQPVLLDQDPSAIILVYSQKFYEEGHIESGKYESMLNDLFELELGLSEDGRRRIDAVPAGDKPRASEIREYFIKNLARETGRMAKACEATDHQEDLDYECIWRDSANRIVYLCVAVSRLLGADIGKLATERWREIESQSIK